MKKEKFLKLYKKIFFFQKTFSNSMILKLYSNDNYLIIVDFKLRSRVLRRNSTIE